MMGCQSPKCPDAARITLTGVKHVLFLTLLMGILLYGITEAGEKAEHKTVARRMSYSIGYQVGGDMKLQQIAVDPKVLLQGVQDALAARTPFLTPLEMREVLAELQKKILADQEAQMKKEAENNLEQGRAFLENNLKKEGVKALPSGLQYRVLREGKGSGPKPEDTVSVYYRGTLIDGTEFDNAPEGRKPAIFRADNVIPAWKEALPLMKEGAKWQLFVPHDLGYGQRRNGRIGPNSALIFEIELVSVNSK